MGDLDILDNDELDEQQDDGNSPPAARKPASKSKPADSDETDWQSKFNGMKGTAEKYRREVVTLKENLEKANQRLSELELNSGSRITELTTELETARKQATESTTLAQKLQREGELGKMIRQKYGAISDLYDDGLLRTEGLEGDALTEYLDRMVTKVGELADAKNRNTHSGSTPPPPPPTHRLGTATTKKEALDAVNSAMTTYGRNSHQYREAMDAYTRFVLQSDDVT